MAETQEEITNHMTNCSVCFEPYKQWGGHVPRMLPCFHTFCEICIQDLLDKNKFDCPECKTTHPAETGARSFKLNKYVLSHLKTLAHVRDLQDERKINKMLLETTKTEIDIPTEKKEKLKKSKADMKERNNKCLDLIDRTRESVIAKFDKMKEDVREETRLEGRSIAIRIGDIEEALIKLKDTREKLENNKRVENDELGMKLDCLTRLAEIPIKYCVYTPCDIKSNRTCGSLCIGVQDRTS